MREGFCARWRSLNVVFTPVAICEVGNTFDFRFSLLDRSRPRDLPIDCTEQVFLKLSRFRKIDARQTQNPCFQGAASSPAYPRYPFPTPFPERTRRGHPYSHSHTHTHSQIEARACPLFFLFSLSSPLPHFQTANKICSQTHSQAIPQSYTSLRPPFISPSGSSFFQFFSSGSRKRTGGLKKSGERTGRTSFCPHSSASVTLPHVPRGTRPNSFFFLKKFSILPTPHPPPRLFAGSVNI